MIENFISRYKVRAIYQYYNDLHYKKTRGSNTVLKQTHSQDIEIIEIVILNVF